ncbi:hypothetical protein [Spirillospora sp. CA-128828]|uniref:hypothetical protein n=1 Tax=Spirillospora sp. CA-128828 TaxID=3240033 RepID=UPI003D8A840F
MRWRVGVWSGVGVTVVAAVGLGVFWKIEGLEEAGWLAGVLSTFAALASLAILLYDRSPSQSGSQPSESAPDPESGTEPAGGSGAGAQTINTFRDATNVGAMVMGRDISGPVTSGSSPPPPPPGPAGAESPTPPAAAGAAPTVGEGAVSNIFSGGFNQGPVVMGRDIRGPVTSLSSASYPAQAGDRKPEERNRPEPAQGEHNAGRPGSGEPPSGGAGR